MADLYERLGGLDAITAVVDSFAARCAADDRINPKFARTDIPRLKKMLVDQICEATGGPCKYTGKSMKDAHTGMNIKDADFNALVEDLVKALGGPCTYTGRSMRETHDGMAVTAGEFDALVEDLSATLVEFDVPVAEQAELLGLLGPLRGDIVEVESPDTGTPLPEAYRAAPSLG